MELVYELMDKERSAQISPLWVTFCGIDQRVLVQVLTYVESIVSVSWQPYAIPWRNADDVGEHRRALQEN